MSDQSRQAANRRTVTKLVLATCLMFSFGYALAPVYNVFCTITGLNGKTGRLTEAQAEALTVDTSRSITVEFVTDVDAQMPWDFRPLVKKVVVHPGVETRVEFEVHNWDVGNVAGQAVPSVAPNTLPKYFKKTECFHPANLDRQRNAPHAGAFCRRSPAAAGSHGLDLGLYVFSVAPTDCVKR